MKNKPSSATSEQKKLFKNFLPLLKLNNAFNLKKLNETNQQSHQSESKYITNYGDRVLNNNNSNGRVNINNIYYCLTILTTIKHIHIYTYSCGQKK